MTSIDCFKKKRKNKYWRYKSAKKNSEL